MRFLGWLTVIFASSVFADNHNPFFSGSDVSIVYGSNSITFGNSAYTRTVSHTLRTTSLKIGGVELLAAPASEGKFTFSDKTVDLGGGTLLGTQTINAADSKILKLWAYKDGFRCRVCYRIFGGNRPWLQKWFEFESQQAPKLVAMERLPIKHDLLQGTYGEWGDSGVVAGGDGKAVGIQVGEIKPLGNCVREIDHLRAEVRMDKPGIITPWSVLALTTGSRYTAAFALQMFWGTYISYASAENRPVIYNTWYAYKWNVTEADCLRTIPIARSLGADYFVVDDGWQSAYGDWLTNPYHFPHGLSYVAGSVRAAGMKFGFWIAPASTRADAATLEEDWLIKNSDGSSWSGNGWPSYCFTTNWSERITDHVTDLIQETGAEFMKLDFTVERDLCFDPTHPHPAGLAVGAQKENWLGFLDRVRSVEPDMVIYRAYTRAENSGYNDFGWWSDWMLAGLNDPRRQDARWWFRSADSTRYGTGLQRYLAPPYCLTGTTPAHIQGFEGRKDLLEYQLTTVAANYCNLEISGNIEGITETERATVRKWVSWYRENQSYLMFAQFDSVTAKAYNPYDQNLYGQEWVDGVYHLRPALNGKYGYLCFWNPSESPKRVIVDINPSDYFLPSGLAQAALYAMNAGWSARSTGATLHSEFTMAPLSWEVIEVTEPGSLGDRSNVTVSGTVAFSALKGPGPSLITVRLTDAAGASSDLLVPLYAGGSFRFTVNLLNGPFTVSAKPTHWLRRTLSAVNSGSPVSGMTFVLANGDPIPDNQTDVLDLNAVLSAYGKIGSASDLDEDGVVGLSDLALILLNFQLIGDL